jgi:hypothetical protein
VLSLPRTRAMAPDDQAAKEDGIAARGTRLDARGDATAGTSDAALLALTLPAPSPEMDKV